MFRSHILASLLAIGLFGLGPGGCGGKPIAFQGDSTLKITGEAPPPPAPPVAEPPRVEVRDNQIAINEKIQFEYDKATIMEVSFSLLNEVAEVIKKNPHIKKIQIEGHASAEGSAAHNQRLSEGRARAVMSYLVQQGVPKNALIARGFGVSRPIADNETPDGREKNRRVEFNILEQDVTQRQVEIDPAGQEKVIEEKTIKASGGTTTSSK
jgi:outer membrane protein OmpA-like peptidoglycan-associated protein